jgi:hypothetical protein
MDALGEILAPLLLRRASFVLASVGQKACLPRDYAVLAPASQRLTSESNEVVNALTCGEESLRRTAKQSGS